jgi:hypothetical protein
MSAGSVKYVRATNRRPLDFPSNTKYICIAEGNVNANNTVMSPAGSALLAASAQLLFVAAQLK